MFGKVIAQEEINLWNERIEKYLKKYYDALKKEFNKTIIIKINETYEKTKTNSVNKIIKKIQKKERISKEEKSILKKFVRHIDWLDNFDSLPKEFNYFYGVRKLIIKKL